MRTAVFTIALLMSSAAVAGGDKTGTTAQDMTQPLATTAALGDPVVAPSNVDPETDARGIAVISAPAFVPDGWNGTPATAVGGPLLDPVTGEMEEGADQSYPACSASVTDNCIQAYERGVDV